MKTIKENWKVALIVAAGVVAVILLCVFGVQSAQNKAFALEEQVNTAQQLKSNENYKELMNELSITENLIAEYRSNYNKQIKEYNRYVKKFPTRIFLNMLGYERQNYPYLDYEAPVDAPQNLFRED